MRPSKREVHQRSVGAGGHVAELLAQLLQLLHGHLGAGLWQSVAGGGGRRVCRRLWPLFGILLQKLERLLREGTVTLTIRFKWRGFSQCETWEDLWAWCERRRVGFIVTFNHQNTIISVTLHKILWGKLQNSSLSWIGYITSLSSQSLESR